MTDGYWRIKQYSPTAKNGFVVTQIPVTDHNDGPDPIVHTFEDAYLTVRYQDGRIEHYPWASIIRAEYQPPTHEKRGT